MAGYIKTQAIGNLTRDPETRFIASGDSVTSFSLAVNRKYKNEQQTLFINASAWGKLGAEVIQKYCVKGDLLFIEGRLDCRKYTDKNGAEREGWSIIVDNAVLLGGAKKNESSHSESHEKPQEDEIPDPGF